MDVTRLPFNRILGLEAAAADDGFLVSLPGGLQYTNHLGTVHAAALRRSSRGSTRATSTATAGSGPD